MKTIRGLMTFFGLSLMLAAFGATGARAQGFTMTGVGGTFDLPLATQWGSMTLPAGNYTLDYGYASSGLPVVQVRGTAKGSPHGIIVAQAHSRPSGTKSAIVCVRDGDALVVRGLQMPAVGDSATFALPRGAQLTAHLRNGKRNIQLAEAPMLIQQVPVRLNEK
jgi:hypothetical protein